MSASETRLALIRRLNADLVGPFEDQEILHSRPLDVYLSGILWPLESALGVEEDDGQIDDEEEGEVAGHVSVFGQMKPSTMGLSFALSPRDEDRFVVHYSFATYERNEITADVEDRKNVETWTRREFSGAVSVIVTRSSDQYIEIETGSTTVLAKLHVRNRQLKEARLVTVTLINTSRLDEGEMKVDGNRKSLFQTKLAVDTSHESLFAGLPDENVLIDEDEDSARMLYRLEIPFAVGHQCSARWHERDGMVQRVETDWLPIEEVRMFSQTGHGVFRKLVDSGHLSARFLSSNPKESVVSAMSELVDSYAAWIDLKKLELTQLPQQFAATAARHIEQCEAVCKRMRLGISNLQSNESLFYAFQLANEAMSTQHSWKFSANDPRHTLTWRPFQAAFILLTLDSICNKESADRNTLDLLWFPTGGGKTEAYLAIVAIGSIYQRLKLNDDHEHGNYAIMRYTLRLLTAQQFERASSLILALETIRRRSLLEKSKKNLGKTPFSIGLWVGSDATPNTFQKAMDKRGQSFGASAEQLTRCPCCGNRLNWKYNEELEEVRPHCSSSDCEYGPNFGKWPITTIDDDIYRVRPTLLIGTVDKFAQLPRKTDVKRLFGFKSQNPTELIIQDELHLISGPLGTVVGAYEVAIDWLLSNEGIRPKVIGSTATIRRAQSQVRALFDRESCQFPPPGLTYDDSGFAVIDENKPPRLYVGISNAGRSSKFTLQAVAGSLLQSAGQEELGDLTSRDGYSTLLMYFNNLRELGAAIVQVLDDVPDSILLYANRRAEVRREIRTPPELTSLRSQSEIVQILNDLNERIDSENSVDVVLATNMVSVGMDIPRLGLMQVVGQPKTRSEYIQATSRVGRAETPGLVVVIHNVLRARDRSLFETFSSWHRRLYRDVEAASVTPFASRARDRTLRAVVVSMLRHADSSMMDVPDLNSADPRVIQDIVKEIERRVTAVDPNVLIDVAEEVRSILDEWSLRDVNRYWDETPKGFKHSLLQSAERFAQKVAVGALPGFAWPVMNSMRSVEPSTPFRLKESSFKARATDLADSDDDKKPWRQI
jgi:hypothetical protein